MLVAEDETQSVLTATENGYGKRTAIVEYTRHGRGTKGMIAIQQTERNGKVVAATLVRPDDEIMLITDKGVLVRTRVSEIRETGPRHAGRDADRAGRRHQAVGPATHRRERCQRRRRTDGDAAGAPEANGSAEPPSRRAPDEAAVVTRCSPAPRSPHAQTPPRRRRRPRRNWSQKLLQLQQPGIESVAPQPGRAARRTQMHAGRRPARCSAVPADKREAAGKEHRGRRARSTSTRSVPMRARARRQAGAVDDRRRCSKRSSPKTN